MNMTIKAGLAIFSLLGTASLQAQTSTGAAPVSGTGAVGTTGTGLSPVGSTDTTGATRLPPAGIGSQGNAANSGQNPVQTPNNQQAQGGGVFGPSSGPGIFGPTGAAPAAGAVTTDIYGNQQPVSGTVQAGGQIAPAQGTAGGQQGLQQGRPQNPISYDANGQPLPSTLYQQSNMPRTMNPIQPSGTQTQQAGSVQPGGVVTGR